METLLEKCYKVIGLFRTLNKSTPEILLLGEMEYEEMTHYRYSGGDGLGYSNDGVGNISRCFGMKVEKVEEVSYIWAK